MSTKLSLKEVLEQRGATQEEPPERSTFRIVKLILSIESVDQPVTVIRLLATQGLGLKKAHAAMDRLAERGCTAVEVPTDDPESVIAELSQLNVHAAVMETPEVDVKSVRQEQGLSQSEFATLYGIDEDTLKNWEQGRNAPDGPAKVLLAVIKTCPSAVIAALTTRPPSDAGVRHPSK
jgi:DNA-binding transcriptional regulator YiaG